MSYIATQHFLSPLGDQNNPLDNSISLKTFKVLDFMHFKFSYHTEHHFFPSLNHQYLPIISEKLKELKPDNYIQAPHISVIKLLYKTPRLYKDNKTLVHLNTKQEVKTDDIKEKLMSMS
jgi:fatty acid desaturase